MNLTVQEQARVVEAIQTLFVLHVIEEMLVYLRCNCWTDSK